MGALVTKALRPIRSFNIENRAHRVISKDKPIPAPKYPQNIEDLKRTLEADPDIDEKLNRKDSKLDGWLKNVYVTSIGRPEDDLTRDQQKQNPNRPLPENRTQPEDFEFGFKEPNRVSYGRTTLRHAINFISAHQTDPTENTVAKIAFENKMKEEHVEDILKYFKTFEVYLPETKTTAAIFAGPTTTRKKLEQFKVNQIEDRKGDNLNINKGKVLLQIKKLSEESKENVEQKDIQVKGMESKKDSPILEKKEDIQCAEKLELQNK